MPRILQLGCGNIGRLVASEFSILGGDLFVADGVWKDNEGRSISGVNHIYCDFEDTEGLTNLVEKIHPDLVISCVPGEFGQNAINAAVCNGVDAVDISFCNIDPFIFEDAARHNKCIVIPDAGLAPGLTNLFTGREFADKGELGAISLYCGGVSHSPFEPYGLSATWSFEDMQEVYTRPARVVNGKKIVETSVKAPMVWICPQYRVEMDAFCSDGLRSLLRYKDKVNWMVEYTLRWPGHFDKLKKLAEDGEFIDELKARCAEVPDTVILDMVFSLGKKYNKRTTLITHATGNYSAMARTTGYTCAGIASLLLSDMWTEPGVHPLEDIGENKPCFNSIIDYLRQKGLYFTTRLE